VPDSHIAIVLAAGASRRLGQPKQLLEVDGESLLVRAVSAALATKPSQLVVALGAEIEACTRALAHLPIRIVVVPKWALGMGTSLATVVAAITDVHSAILVLGVDQPALDASFLQRLVRSWHAQPLVPVASAYAGILGIPAIFPAHYRARLSTLSGDRGARQLLRDTEDRVRQVRAPQLALDIDKPEDWDRFQQARSDI